MRLRYLSGCRAMKAQMKMRMLVRVPPKDLGEVRLILVKEYGIAIETHSLRPPHT